MVFTEWFEKGQGFTRENSSTILTAVGVTGTVTTAYLTGKASVKAHELIKLEEAHIYRLQDGVGVKLEFKDQARLVWKEYIPAASVGVLTISSIIGANHISSRKATALAAAYGLSERALVEYKEKVVEHLGKNKELKVREEIAQDRVSKNPVSQVIITGNGDVLCYDALTGRYFESNIETIKKAMNDINYRIMNHGSESLSAFYDEVGLPPTSLSDEIGWNSNELMDIAFATTMSTDDRPCISIDFTVAPAPHYNRLY